MRQIYIQDPITQQIRLTQVGIEKYGARFARAGFQASQIRTVEAFKAAVDASFTNEMVSLATTAKGNNAELDEIMTGLPGWE